MLHLCDDRCKHFVIIVVNERRSTMAATVCAERSSIDSTPSPARRGAFARRIAVLVAGVVLTSVGVVSVQGAQAAPVTSGTARVALPSGCKASYTVRVGDGWTVIAARLQVKVGDLYALNGASSGTPLYAGRAICVPANAKGATPVPSTIPNSPGSTRCTKSYTVKPGDAWTTIAARHKVSVEALYSVNRSNSRTVLFAGRTICLPANASTPSSTPPTTTPPVTVPPTTAPAPTTTARPPATVPPAKTNWTQAEVIAIIRQVWPDHLEEKAIAIAWRESNHKPGVRNFCCFGLFQIYWNVHKGWLASMGITSAEQLYHPQANAYAALVLYNRAGGWGPWGG
jgi:LysM repeat protein